MTDTTILCAECGRECSPVNDSDAPTTVCVDCYHCEDRCPECGDFCAHSPAGTTMPCAGGDA